LEVLRDRARPRRHDGAGRQSPCYLDGEIGTREHSRAVWSIRDTLRENVRHAEVGCGLYSFGGCQQKLTGLDERCKGPRDSSEALGGGYDDYCTGSVNGCLQLVVSNYVGGQIKARPGVRVMAIHGIDELAIPSAVPQMPAGTTAIASGLTVNQPPWTLWLDQHAPQTATRSPPGDGGCCSYAGTR